MTSRAWGDIEEVKLPTLAAHLENDRSLSVAWSSVASLSISHAGAEARVERSSTAALLLSVEISGACEEQILPLVELLTSKLTALRIRHRLEVGRITSYFHYLWPEPPGRLFQDDRFVVPGMEGAEVSSFFALARADPADDHVILLYLKPTYGSWQHIFLDAGLAFWEDWGFKTQMPPAELDSDVRLIDLAARYDLIRSVVLRAWSDGDLENGKLASLTLLFGDGGKLVLHSMTRRTSNRASEWLCPDGRQPRA